MNHHEPDFARRSTWQGFWDMGDHRDAGNNCGFEFIIWLSWGGDSVVPCVQGSAKFDVVRLSSDGWYKWALINEVIWLKMFHDHVVNVVLCFAFLSPTLAPTRGFRLFQTRCLARKAHLLDLDKTSRSILNVVHPATWHHAILPSAHDRIQSLLFILITFD